MIRKYVGDFTFNESAALRHQPNIVLNRNGLSPVVGFENGVMRIQLVFALIHHALFLNSLQEDIRNIGSYLLLPF